MRVLDAGCGRGRQLALPEDAYIVGIDASSEALALNTSIDEAICGDIETYPLPRKSFDLILALDVLEHLRNPEVALASFARALAPGGRIFITMPNPLSGKGILTKLTPHRFHVWAYRHIVRFPYAGENGYGPFPTFLRLSPRRLRLFAAKNGLELTLSLENGSMPSHLVRAFRPVWSLLAFKCEVKATLKRTPATNC